jgi:glycosyltransferase involved in cell wall biosynthesis/peptidoglycan/xylan/chitin deacetylase (PgdA/CDA1 family)
MNQFAAASPGDHLSKTLPQLSVVMATYNRRHILPRAIDSIFKQDLPPTEYELIVVVDGSNDGTTEYLKSLLPPCPLQIIEQTNRGLAVALNRGISAARGKIVLLVDDDLVLDPSNFRIHLEAHAANDSLLVHGPVYIAKESADNFATEWIREVVDEEIKRWEMGWTWPDDANIDPNYSIPRAALLATGGYDENFKWRQNTEFGVRLVKSGIKVVYEPGAICHHVYSKTPKQLLNIQMRSWGHEEIVLLRKHPELRPYSLLALLSDGSPSKRFAIKIIARSPISPDLFLRPLFALTEWLYSWAPSRKVGMRLMRKRIIIQFFRSAAESAGWHHLQSSFGKRLPVLMYHHVGPPQKNFNPDLTIPTDKFKAQIRYLAMQGYVGIRPSDWLAWVRDGKPLPEKPILLTFDDAFEDLNDHVFPVLEHYGFGGLVFVATHYVGRANIWDELRGFDLLPCLDAGQIRQAASDGIDFGAHSRSHPDLTKIEEPKINKELAGSRSDLEHIVRDRVTSFAYPYGHYDAKAAVCAARHFDMSFTTDDGLNTLRTRLNLLHRNMVYAWDTPLDLEFLVRLGCNPVRSLNLRLRKRLRFLKVAWRKLHLGSHRISSQKHAGSQDSTK